MIRPATIFMFSGQGSQYYQMGRDFFEQEPTFRKKLLDMDAVVCDLIGTSVVRALFDRSRTKAEPFDRLALTHPAIFMVQFALAQSLIEHGVIPDYTLSVSLGSFAAAAVSGCIHWKDALYTVVQQARNIENHCGRGGMIAILADPEVHKDDVLFRNSEIAALNFSSHFIVAAKEDRLPVLAARLEQKRVSYQHVPVWYAFHSQWIDEAEEPFADCLRTLSCKPAKIPVICCTNTAVLTNISAEYFWHAIRKRICFSHTIAKIEAIGPHRYIDMGPSGTLATFLKYILGQASSSTVLSTLTPFGDDLSRLKLVIDVGRRNT